MSWRKYKSFEDLPDPVPPGRYVINGVKVVARESTPKSVFMNIVKGVREIVRKEKRLKA